MPRTRSTRHSREVISRTVAVESFGASVGLLAAHRRGEEPEIETQCWLELRGRMSEPVESVTGVNVTLHPEEPLRVGTAWPAAIGAIVQVKPELQAVLGLTHADFDRVWTLADARSLKFACLAFTTPRRGKSLIVSASFSNEREE